MKNGVIYFVLFVAMLTASCSFTAENNSDEVLLVFNEDGETPRGAWVSGVYGGDAKRDKEENIISVSLTAEKQKLRVAFNKHQPWNYTEVKDPSVFKLYLRLQSTEDFTGKIQWGWYDKNKKTSSPSAYTPITLEAGKWKDVYLPMPTNPEFEDDIVRGLYINAQQPITIKIQHIAIVAKK